MAKIGIVTVLYNSEGVLEEFFRTLDEQTFKDFTLYVIDNASKDNSLKKAIELSNTVSFKTVFFPEKENWGIAKGNNIGIKAALNDKCDYVLLSNNDIVLNVKTIENLYQGLISTSADMAVPKIFYYDTNLIWCAGGDFSWLKGLTYHYGNNKKDAPCYNITKFVNYSPTCFMLISKYVFDKVGFMDEKYFVYYDDTDFVWRAVMQNKIKLAYIPQSSLLHKESACTGRASSPFKLKYLFRNSRYFSNKNLSFPRKQINQLYSFLHTNIRKPFVYSKEQMKIIREAIKEGNKM